MFSKDLLGGKVGRLESLEVGEGNGIARLKSLMFLEKNDFENRAYVCKCS